MSLSTLMSYFVDFLYYLQKDHLHPNQQNYFYRFYQITPNQYGVIRGCPYAMEVINNGWL